MSDSVRESEIACGLCGETYTVEQWGFGNNSMPLSSDPDQDRCCDRCNSLYVVPARVMGVQEGSDEARFVRRLADYGGMFWTFHRKAEDTMRQLQAFKKQNEKTV